jgi:hypothetical protein
MTEMAMIYLGSDLNIVTMDPSNHKNDLAHLLHTKSDHGV